MYFSYIQACAWLKTHLQELTTLTQEHTIVICPDFTILSHMQETEFRYGAQNCAQELTGAYTGEVSAQTLKELGCSYCIIGHSERRRLFGETAQACAQKVQRLQECGITPIYCIGEEDFKQDPVLELAPKNLIIAYEPVWAIGTGVTPTIAELQDRIGSIKEYTEDRYPVLYGGSVNGKNSAELKKVTGLDGFLIGKASTDFQELKKIVL